MTFLSPLAALVALAALLPALGIVAAGRRLARVRAALGLAPGAALDRRHVAASVAVVLLLALAAAQPAWTTNAKQRVRTDAQTLFVLDISQSMKAGSPSRLARAKRAAETLRAAIPEVPSGVATLTDRVLPYLLPVPDQAAFDTTVSHSVLIEEPPPSQQDVRATSFGALAPIPAHGYFEPGATKRVVVLLTDGESSPFDGTALAKQKIVAVRFWKAGEHIAGDPNYTPDPTSALLIRQVTPHAYDESQLSAAVSQLRTLLGSGPTKTTGRAETIHPLGPYAALLALLPLALVLRRRGMLLVPTTP